MRPPQACEATMSEKEDEHLAEGHGDRERVDTF